MTDRELLEQALEALEYPGPSWPEARQKAATALRERLAQPERVNQCGETCERAKLCATCARGLDEQPEQEPVAWLHRDSWGTLKLSQTMPPPVGAFPVYTAPLRREWVSLTDEEIMEPWPFENRVAFARWLEAKLKEKNA